VLIPEDLIDSMRGWRQHLHQHPEFGFEETETARFVEADMDCLRIHETTNLPYASTKPGLMHACGHDGHTTILLGVASMLAKEGGFDGTVLLVFQPAEEWGQGMR